MRHTGELMKISKKRMKQTRKTEATESLFRQECLHLIAYTCMAV